MWYGFLDAHFPATGFGRVLLRTFVDQIIMCPIGLAVFFTFMTIAEGGGQKALKRKFMEAHKHPVKGPNCRDTFLH